MSSPESMAAVVIIILTAFAAVVYGGSPDFEAISAVLRRLGHRQTAPPCRAAAGVYCEPYNNSAVVYVTRVVLTSQRLAGVLSPAVGRLSNLHELSLSGNRISGELPASICSCKALEILDLKNNNFSGNLPPDLSSLVNLKYLDLSGNSFSGDLRFLKHLPKLEHISISGDLLAGAIPAHPATSRRLKSIALSESNNVNEEQNTPKVEKKQKKKKKGRENAVRWAAGFMAGAAAGALTGVAAAAAVRVAGLWIKGKEEGGGAWIYSAQIKEEDLEFLLEKEKKKKEATAEAAAERAAAAAEEEGVVSKLQVIGRGGCGEVYRAELSRSKGKMIAIKKIIHPSSSSRDFSDSPEDTRDSSKKMKQIRSEINTVGKIRHRNLLPLLAHVSRPNCDYLVYEFMKNGSLQDIMTEVAANKRDLEWSSRLTIALGVISGLEYLHMDQSPRIIHRDLKPANVLLDDDMEARIADFGLAKAIPDANTHATSSSVAGTVGYIAPEYHQTLKFTDKCDVYSYGVLLAVLVVGKFPSDDFFFRHTDADMGLVKWMRKVMGSENPERCIDEKLVGKGDQGEMLLALKISCFCTSDDPKQRPSSKEVRCMLTQITSP